MYITLSSLKQSLNIDLDHKDDDALLLMYLEAAENTIEKHLGYSLSQLAESNDGELPAEIKCCVMMSVGSLYNTRESVSYASISQNPMFNYLISLSRNYAVAPNRHPHFPKPNNPKF